MEMLPGNSAQVTGELRQGRSPSPTRDGISRAHHAVTGASFSRCHPRARWERLTNHDKAEQPHTRTGDSRSPPSYFRMCGPRILPTRNVHGILPGALRRPHAISGMIRSPVGVICADSVGGEGAMWSDTESPIAAFPRHRAPRLHRPRMAVLQGSIGAYGSVCRPCFVCYAGR